MHCIITDSGLDNTTKRRPATTQFEQVRPPDSLHQQQWLAKAPKARAQCSISTVTICLPRRHQAHPAMQAGSMHWQPNWSTQRVPISTMPAPYPSTRYVVIFIATSDAIARTHADDRSPQPSSRPQRAVAAASMTTHALATPREPTSSDTWPRS